MGRAFVSHMANLCSIPITLYMVPWISQEWFLSVKSEVTSSPTRYGSRNKKLKKNIYCLYISNNIVPTQVCLLVRSKDTEMYGTYVRQYIKYAYVNFSMKQNTIICLVCECIKIESIQYKLKFWILTVLELLPVIQFRN